MLPKCSRVGRGLATVAARQQFVKSTDFYWHCFEHSALEIVAENEHAAGSFNGSRGNYFRNLAPAWLSLEYFEGTGLAAMS